MREVNPMDTDRAVSWQLYIDAPMPMVTIFKTLQERVQKNVEALTGNEGRLQ